MLVRLKYFPLLRIHGHKPSKALEAISLQETLNLDRLLNLPEVYFRISELLFRCALTLLLCAVIWHGGSQHSPGNKQKKKLLTGALHSNTRI